MLAGPTEVVDEIANQVGAWKILGKEYVFLCGSDLSYLPVFEINIAGKTFILEGKDYVIKQS